MLGFGKGVSLYMLGRWELLLLGRLVLMGYSVSVPVVPRGKCSLHKSG